MLREGEVLSARADAFVKKRATEHALRQQSIVSGKASVAGLDTRVTETNSGWWRYGWKLTL